MRSIGYGVVIATCLIGAAHADVITVEDNGGGFTDPSEGESLSSFAAFDSTLGTLTGVSVNIRYASVDALTLQSTGSSGQVVGSFSPLLSLDIANAMVPLPEFTPITKTVAFFGTPPIAHTFIDIIGNFVVEETHLADFVGPVSPEIDMYVGAGVVLGQGFFSTEGIFNTGVAATITYTYTPTDPSPIPEPASIIVLGLGALGVARVSRGRR